MFPEIENDPLKVPLHVQVRIHPFKHIHTEAEAAIQDDTCSERITIYIHTSLAMPSGAVGALEYCSMTR